MSAELIAPGVLLSIGRGHLDAAFVEPFIQALGATITQHGSVKQFHDWLDLESYDSSARLRLTTHQVAIRSKVTAFHLLTVSRLVRMGVAVANIALGNTLQLHDTRASFERVLHAARAG